MKIHFIGIGGIGVSALAQYYLAKGHEVSGFDLESSEITDLLEKKGIVSKTKIGIRNGFEYKGEKFIEKDFGTLIEEKGWL